MSKSNNAIYYFRHIWNEWGTSLTHSELRVLLFIFMRTLMYGKMEERIPIRHFTDGVFTGDECVTAPVGLGKKWVIEVVAALQKKGLITKISTKGESSIYSINVQITGQFLHSFAKNNSKKSNTRTQKKSNSGEVQYTGVGRYSTPPYIPKVYYKEDNLKGTHYVRKGVANICKKKEEKMVDMEKLKSVGENRKTKTAKTRNENIAKLNVTSAWTVWSDSYREFYPKTPFPEWRGYEGRKIHDAITSTFGKERIKEFIFTIVSEWKNILSSEFRYMSSKPQLPVIGFVIKFFPEFAAAFLRLTNEIKAAPTLTAAKQRKRSSTTPKPSSGDTKNMQEVIALRQKLKDANHALKREKFLREQDKRKQKTQRKPTRQLRLKNLPEWE